MKALLLMLAIAPFWQAENAVLPPAGTQPLVSVQGRGVQIYHCQAQGAAFSWSLLSPEAALFNDSGLRVGQHAAGPTWTWNDGSSITGKLLAKQPSPTPGSIPWLLLKASPANEGGKYLADVAYVRRSETQGGEAPDSGCDATHAGALLRVPYTATYTFYKKTK
ncbi:MAG: DUF3455 domain-containing protein [Acidobacteriaceae bacterium]|nr:DUF3455 domain-containing protein [Acidobacteriaceae bacterium]